MTAVRDAIGQVHESNPLGAGACLACALPFPCPTARGGEQLDFGVCRCGLVHQPRERDVVCRGCRGRTEDHHALCRACQLREVFSP